MQVAYSRSILKSKKACFYVKACFCRGVVSKPISLDTRLRLETLHSPESRALQRAARGCVDEQASGRRSTTSQSSVKIRRLRRRSRAPSIVHLQHCIRSLSFSETRSELLSRRIARFLG